MLRIPFRALTALRVDVEMRNAGESDKADPDGLAGSHSDGRINDSRYI